MSQHTDTSAIIHSDRAIVSMNRFNKPKEVQMAHKNHISFPWHEGKTIIWKYLDWIKAGVISIPPY